MAREEFILSVVGLQGVKPALYSRGLGDPLPVGGGDYPDQAAQPPTRMNTGSADELLVSYLGTPVWADLTLRISETATEFLNLQTVLLTVEQEKNIVKTAPQGRSGTVKEYISAGDYSVTIRGAMVGQSPDEYPIDQVKQFLALVEANTAIVAISPFLQLFQIYNIVVETWRLEQLQGYQNVQPFEINAVSDTPIELVEDV